MYKFSSTSPGYQLSSSCMLFMSRERRSWTAEEDRLLREAVEIENPGSSSPSKWYAIAKHVPNRTNKDCRKRWFAKMASDVVKGGWAPDEDERLMSAIKKYGTRWSLIATVVQTRNSDQCAKRWTDTLNPEIDRTSWSPAADAMLIKAVDEHGKVWTKIVKTYFPGRTGLSAKNRYNSITRFDSHSRTKNLRTIYHRKPSSTSSSSSGSPTISTLPTPDPPSLYSPSPSDHLETIKHQSSWINSNLSYTEEPDSFSKFNSPGYINSPLPLENISSSMGGVTATSLSAFSDDIFTNNYASLPPLSTSRSSQFVSYSPDLHYQQTLRTNIPRLSTCTATSVASLTMSGKWDTLNVSHDHGSWDRYNGILL